MNTIIRLDKPQANANSLARQVLLAFLMTFMLSRSLVYVAMSGHIPCIYTQVAGFHIHHFVYGIILLTIVSGYLLFKQPLGRALQFSALLFGVAVALIYDEFGMWVFLIGGNYWQRVSIDAIVILFVLIALLAYMPSLKNLKAYYFKILMVLIVFLMVFSVAIYKAGAKIGCLHGLKLYKLEQDNDCHPM